MGYYNSGIMYNLSGADGGLIYNGGAIVIYVNIADSLKVQEEEVPVIVKLIIKEYTQISDAISLLGKPVANDWFGMSDDKEEVSLRGLIPVLDNLNVSDDFINGICKLIVTDTSTKIVDELSLLAYYEMEEEIDFEDYATTKSLAELADSLNLSEIASLLGQLTVKDTYYAQDEDSRISVSDFYVGDADGLDDGWRYLTPFDLIINEGTSSFQVMPQTESTYTDLPTVDGSVITDTIYKNRFFNIVGYSQQGLTETQKDDLQQQIVSLLNSTKSDFKQMTIERTGTVFDVKYSGTAEFSEAPSWVKATLPFEVKPYGRKNFPETFTGTGLIYNTGDKDIGVICIISSGCVTPYFSIGGIEYKWTDTVPDNQTLYIDFENQTCYLEDAFGVKYQALDRLEKTQWVSIASGYSAELNCLNTSTASHISTEYYIYVLWKA